VLKDNEETIDEMVDKANIVDARPHPAELCLVRPFEL
jgi:hypothetical protein